MKVSSLFTILALCLLGTSGCDSDMAETDPLQPGQKVLMTMKAAGPQTRADYFDTGFGVLFSWNSGDEISVAVDGASGNENCKLTSSSSGKSASFSGTVTSWSGTKNVYAFYPYSSSGYTVTGSDNPSTATATLTLPNPQSYTVFGPISNSFLVGAGIATSSGGSIDAYVSMKQVMSIIRLNIYNGPTEVTSVRLSCDEAIFPTTATVNLADGTISNPGLFVNELYLKVTDINSNPDKTISFAMFPANLIGKIIHVEVGYGNGLAKSIEKTGLSFERNIHYVMSFDASGADIPYVEIDGLKWATGNLVAYGANDAKVGLSIDGGLYFQYGSLIGWSGGSNGDGTGRGTDNANPSLSQVVTPSSYTGGNFLNPHWTGDTSVDDPSAGTGDPCRYYLGGTWRLPTNAEYISLFQNSGYPYSGPWIAAGNFGIGSSNSFAKHTSNLKFPAAGYRMYYNGTFADVGEYGYYWASDIFNPLSAYSFSFHSSNLSTNIDSNRSNGVTVRCVSN